MTRIAISIEHAVPKLVPAPSSGVVGFIGWHRLAQALQAAGEIRPSETVTHFAATERGLEFFVKTEEPR